MKNEMDDKMNNNVQPLPIGTDAQGALQYLGCSDSVFKDLRRRGYFSELRPGWFLYEDLILGMQRLRIERDESLRRVRDEVRVNVKVS